LPDCADVHSEWQGSKLEADFQVHISTAIYGSKISLKSLRRVLKNMDIEHEDSDSIGQLHTKLKRHITDLRRGKKVEQSQEQERVAQAKYVEDLEAIWQLWPQPVPQSLKNKRLCMFRNQTSSEVLSTFTCATCAESVSLRDHCSVRVGDSYFDLTVLKRPDLNSDETNILDRYKWLHPDCISPPMPFDEGPLRDLLLDPDGVSLSTDGGSPVLSLCKSCHSYLKRKKMPAFSLANSPFLGTVPSELKDLTVIEEAMIAIKMLDTST
jgi:hypothetical protein